MINILGICSVPEVMQVLNIVKTVINIIRIAVPILLVVFSMINYTRAIMNNDSDALKKANNVFVIKIISATLVFLIPTFLLTITKISSASTEYRNCLSNATSDNINAMLLSRADEYLDKANSTLKMDDYYNAYNVIYKLSNGTIKDEYIIKLQELKKKIDEERKRLEEEKKKKKQEYVFKDYGAGVKPPTPTGRIVSIGTTPDQIGCQLMYKPTVSLRSISFNDAKAGELKDILSSICSDYGNNKEIFVPYVQTAGAYVAKAGYHGKGLAIDLFDEWKFVNPENGLSYYPYAGMGNGTYNNYKRFICEACNGEQNCKYNINYLIYKKYFQPKGWCWGGTWQAFQFDPMHYSYGECPNREPPAINCG